MSGRRAISIAACGILLVYAAFPTKNYYWDGIAFANSIEGLGERGPALLHPNHLLYNPIGLALWSALEGIGIHVRALYVLQGLNMLLAALAAALLMGLLLRETESLYLSLSLGALFAFSSHWWKFSTDANAYILSVLLLLLAFRELLGAEPRPIRVALWHAAAMLVHQLAVFFFPVAVAGLLATGRWRALARYAALAAAITLPAYYAGFRLTESPATFFAWLTSHSPEVSFTFNPAHNLTLSATSYLRLFLGGRVSLARQFFGPFTVVCLAGFVAVLAALIVQLVRGRREWGGQVRGLPRQRLAVIWIVSYAVFLFFWLPQNTFYKLFLLPPVIYAASGWLARYSGPRYYRLALVAAAVALSNLTLSIYPYTHAEANAPLSFAQRIGTLWSEKTVIYYASFNPDDWYIRYFNPKTTWKRLDIAALERDAAAGRDVWLDTTAADELKAGGRGLDLIDAQHRIRFVRYH